MILNALVEKLKRRAKGDFKGRHYEAALKGRSRGTEYVMGGCRKVLAFTPR